MTHSPNQRFPKLSRLLFITTLLSLSSSSLAGTLMLRFGPASAGTGGSNPLSLPPSAADTEAAWITDSKWETSLSIVPGLLIGKRHQMDRFYVGLGGGVIIDANGVGIGPYSSFGWEIGSTFKFGFEYKQALGLTSVGIIHPYALRMSFGIAL
jgi:hypothetical protein